VKNRRKTPPEERFATKFVVDAATGCWLWTAYRNPQGYGQFSDGVRMVLAHRWAYEHWIGPVPGGLDLDHFACDNPACVNPEHVRPVTHRENMLRGNTPSAAQRARTHCVRGHPFSGENLYITTEGRRSCRACHRMHERNRVDRKGRQIPWKPLPASHKSSRIGEVL